MSMGEGCGIPECHCSDGYWLTISLPLNRGDVEVVTVIFDNKKEMDKFFETHEINGK